MKKNYISILTTAIFYASLSLPAAREEAMELLPYRGEPDIQRLFSAFQRQRVDRVPNFEVLIEDQHVEKLLGRFAGNTLSYGGDPAKGVSESEGARPMKSADYIELCKLIGQDAIIVESIWTPFKKRNPDGSLGGMIADRSIKNRSDWKSKVVFPGEAEIEEKMVFVREYRQAIDRSGTKIGFCVLMAASFQMLYEFVIGLEDTMKLVYQDRDFIEEMLEVSTDYWVRFCKAAVANGVDFIWTADDVAFKTGLFLPPKLMREMWLPKLKRIHEPALAAGKPIMFHSDGNIDELVPMLLEAGVSCINPMDPYGVDYRSFKKKWGGLACLSGNIDIEFPLAHGRPEEVDADVKAHMDVLKPGGGYVCGSSHSIVNYIPHENFIAMLNAIHKYGVYEDKAWAVKGKKVPAPKVAERVERIHEQAFLKKLKEDLYRKLFDQVYRGDSKGIASSVQAALQAGHDPLDIIARALTPAIKAVGDKFSTGEMFLPELLMAAGAMQEAMKVLTPLLRDRRESASKGKVVIGTIKGDLHDIGKNIVRALLEGNGFQVVDIGIDNAPEKYIQAIKTHQPQVVGYSGLLTTTLAGMPEQIAALKEAGLRDRVITIVGGAPVSADFAKRNGVDLYGRDANEAVKVIEKALVRTR
jgi:5-methyltetrahydrofolate--homocysteine methyltransferase